MKKTPRKNKPKMIEKKPVQKKKSLHGKIVRVPGIDRGKIVIKSDFDDPLPEFEV